MDSAAPPGSDRWLFSRRTDLLVFTGAALLSVAVAALAPRLGIEAETPPWAWLVFVVGFDVSHVWSTLYRTYFDVEELRRRPLLYTAAPAAALALGVLAHQVSSAFFWRALAYGAAWHFVRQQVGWMVLYAHRAKSGPAELWWDRAAAYAATLGPLVWWHAHLPRPFWWFKEGDFAEGLPAALGTLALAVEAVVLAAWLAQHLRRARSSGFHPARLLFLAGTTLTWLYGIVWARSDFAFTVTNVVTHGVPYLTLLARYARGRVADGGYGRLAAFVRVGAPAFLGLLFLVAWVEEWAWDRLVWHEHALFFGDGGLDLGAGWLSLVVPLLALPQVTHYLLDGWVWRTREDPKLAGRLGFAKAPAPAG